jgi:hypothetical protein
MDGLWLRGNCPIQDFELKNQGRSDGSDREGFADRRRRALADRAPRATSRCITAFSASVIGAEGGTETDYLMHSQHVPTLEGPGSSLLHFRQWV